MPVAIRLPSGCAFSCAREASSTADLYSAQSRCARAEEPLRAVRVAQDEPHASAPRLSDDHPVCRDRAVLPEQIASGESAQVAAVVLQRGVDFGKGRAADPVVLAKETRLSDLFRRASRSASVSSRARGAGLSGRARSAALRSARGAGLRGGARGTSVSGRARGASVSGRARGASVSGRARGAGLSGRARGTSVSGRARGASAPSARGRLPRPMGAVSTTDQTERKR